MAKVQDCVWTEGGTPWISSCFPHTTSALEAPAGMRLWHKNGRESFQSLWLNTRLHGKILFESKVYELATGSKGRTSKPESHRRKYVDLRVQKGKKKIRIKQCNFPFGFHWSGKTLPYINSKIWFYPSNFYIVNFSNKRGILNITLCSRESSS